MHKLIFYPLGNADCTQIQLDGGKRILFDFADTHDSEDKEDLRCDLEKEIRDSLDEDERDSFDVVAITHLDEDHYKRFSEVFWLKHAAKYQDDERIKIGALWVPAAAITEEGLEKAEAKVIQKEARHRFEEGKDIRVFSRPERLKEWCRKNDVDFASREHLVTDAGNLAPEFDLDTDGVEFFVHSPFAKRLNDSEVEDRNQDSLVMHATFVWKGVQTRFFLMGDATHEVITDIVNITEERERKERLEFEVCKLPHHCSYLSLGEEKGTRKTEPEEAVARLYEEYGQSNVVIVSTSKPIPAKGSEEDSDSNPPHRQAANYYKEDVVDSKEDFLVTMEHPKDSEPKPLEIQIDECQATVVKGSLSVGAAIVGGAAPRAGC